jgi:DHA1 family tetracycline resistance protein-like MFS transporter
MIAVIYAGGQFIAAPLIGKLGDRYGRRPVLLLSVLGQSIGYSIFGFGGSLWMLFLGRLIGGITAGNLSTAGAYIADVSRPEERSRNFTIIGTAWSLGLILGPALGGIFGQFSLQAPAFVAAALALLSVLLGLFLLPESLPLEKRNTSRMSLRDYNPIATIFDMARKPGLGLLLLVNAIFSFAFNGASSTSALFVIQKFSAATWQVSLLLVLSGVSIALTNTFIVPRVIPLIGEKRSGVSSMLASCMNSFIFPVLTTLSAEQVEVQEIGMLMGVTSAVGSLTNIFGPLWAGIVYDQVMHGAPYWMGALILLVSAWTFSRAKPRPPISIVQSSY